MGRDVERASSADTKILASATMGSRGALGSRCAKLLSDELHGGVLIQVAAIADPCDERSSPQLGRLAR